MTMFFHPANPSQRATSIDMLDPTQTCERLALAPAGLLDLVNRGELAAYDLGDGIRFRTTHVDALTNQLLAG